MRKHVAIAIALTLAAAGFRLFLVLDLPNDDDGAGRFYVWGADMLSPAITNDV